MKMPARLALRLAAVAVLALGLSGCFQPLYGTASFQSVRPTMGAIKVAEIPGHIGHQLKSELDFLLNNGTPPETPQYTLTVRPSGVPSAIIVDSLASRPQTMTYPVTASYTLVSAADGRVVSTATANSTVSFDRDPQRYATIRAQRDAEIRAGKALAEQIRLRIVADLVRQNSGG